MFTHTNEHGEITPHNETMVDVWWRRWYERKRASFVWSKKRFWMLSQLKHHLFYSMHTGLNFNAKCTLIAPRVIWKWFTFFLLLHIPKTGGHLKAVTLYHIIEHVDAGTTLSFWYLCLNPRKPHYRRSVVLRTSPRACPRPWNPLRSMWMSSSSK